MSENSLQDSLEIRELADSPASAAPDFAALKELDCTNTDLLRPTLAALLEVNADRFEPARFHFVQALAQAALKQRQSVARVLEQKALQALRDYLADYLPAREQAMALVDRVACEKPEAAERIGGLFAAGDIKGVEQMAAWQDDQDKEQQSVMAALIRELLQPGELVTKSSFEDELGQQERAFIQSVAGTGNGPGDRAEPGQNIAGESSAMRHFRQSLVQHNGESRVARALRDGPENPGPLNAQALIIRCLSTMRNLSPVYANRLVSYMETLSWLEQAGAAVAPAKSKRRSRRKA